jgi:hypothetical protein
MATLAIATPHRWMDCPAKPRIVGTIPCGRPAASPRFAVEPLSRDSLLKVY